MRVIEFRAWNNYQDAMVSWDELQDEHYNKLEDFNDGVLEFMQYTNINGKNGEKVFEGDKLKFPNEDGIYFVKYSTERAGFVAFPIEYLGKDTTDAPDLSAYWWSRENSGIPEVIGHIFEEFEDEETD